MATFNKLEGTGKHTMDIPHDWDNVIGSARHTTSPFNKPGGMT
jgi:hypothetical protein